MLNEMGVNVVESEETEQEETNFDAGLEDAMTFGARNCPNDLK